MNSTSLDDWRQMNLGERIVRAAWIATREHLSDAPDRPRRSPDQADGLRRLVLERRARLLQEEAE